MKILILKPSSLGDVIHALPVLRLLKLHLPKAEIYWWLDASLVPLLEHDPDLSGIITFHRKRWAAPRHWPELVRSVRDMRAQHFDWAIDLQGLARSGLFAWLARAGLTVGLDNPREGAREGAVAFYDITPPRAAGHLHAVDRYLAVLPLLGIPVHKDFDWLPRSPQAASQVEQKWGQPSDTRWIALLPGGRWDSKRWPAGAWAELVKQMSGVPNLKFILLGSKDEQALAQTIADADAARCLNLAGRTTLLEMVELIRACGLVITNDTGPMHVAAAVRRPVIAIFGPTDPVSTGPYGQLGNVLQNLALPCVPCMRQTCTFEDPLACLRSITPQSVALKARRVLDGTGGAVTCQ